MAKEAIEIESCFDCKYAFREYKKCKECLGEAMGGGKLIHKEKGGKEDG